MAKDKIEISDRIFTVIVILLIGIVSFWGFRIYEIWNVSKGNYAREITVEATGKAYVVPDVAKVTLGVKTEAKTAEEAVTQNTQKMNSITAEVKTLGIDEKDIKTTGYYLNPKYIYSEKDKKEIQDGFILEQTVEVTIRDFEKIGKIMTSATKNGANNISGLTFVVDDPESAKSQAREEAIAKAKVKAKQISKDSGLKLGRVINFYEYEDYGYYPMPMAADSYLAEAQSNMVTPLITPGEKEVSLRVTLTYRVY